MSNEIVPQELAVKSLRDSGYKSTAYALSELMDNSIQAGADHVELLCVEEEIVGETRRRVKLHEIAVLDDGQGMDEETLLKALQFGNGTHLKVAQQNGMGKFGIGLPNASISQAMRVDVWSWQKGVDSALHTYLDLKDVYDQTQREIPVPKSDSIPELWLNIGQVFGSSGTLVVWSRIDRCIWKTAQGVLDNSAFLIGRMYRKFLHDGKVSIRLLAYNKDTQKRKEEFARPNDPTYLMANTSCPPPYDKEAMFNELSTREFAISFRGTVHAVQVRFSMAKNEARKGINAGATAYGNHAGRNVGVSIIRAGRELDLDQTWTINYDPRERWWGCEVIFPPALDDLFGVTNSKQSARNFSELAKFDIGDLLKEGKTIVQLRDEMIEDEDPRAPLLEVVDYIKSQLGNIRGWIKQQKEGTGGSNRRYQTPKAEEIATAATRERQQEGHEGSSDEDEKLPEDEKQRRIEATLTSDGVEKDSAHELAAKTVSSGLKYQFHQAALDTPAFFSVKPDAGIIIITLNTKHPAYSRLIEVLDRDDTQEEDRDALLLRLEKASKGLKLLLTAWARYEDEQQNSTMRDRAQEVRTDWGRLARRFFDIQE